MSTASFISPIGIESIRLTGSEVKISDAPAPSEFDANLTLSTGVSPVDGLDDASAESYRMTVPLRAVAHLAPKGKADEEYASLMASGDITVTFAKSALPDGTSVEETLMSNAVSILYGYLRASLASMTARTSLRDYVLPAINPVAYVRAIMRQAKNQPEPAGTKS